MNTNLGLALQITLVGMGLVFAAIVLLWGVMSLLVRLTTDAQQPDILPNESAESDLKRQAAAVAVSIALAQQSGKSELHAFPLPPTALVSAWQAVMRSTQLQQRGPR